MLGGFNNSVLRKYEVNISSHLLFVTCLRCYKNCILFLSLFICLAHHSTFINIKSTRIERDLCKTSVKGSGQWWAGLLMMKGSCLSVSSHKLIISVPVPISQISVSQIPRISTLHNWDFFICLFLGIRFWVVQAGLKLTVYVAEAGLKLLTLLHHQAHPAELF